MDPSLGYSCNGACTGWVDAPGISYTCKDNYTSVNLVTIGVNGTYGFAVGSRRFNDANSVPTLEVLAKRLNSTDSTCNAVLVTTSCLIHSGNIKYPVKIQNSTTLLRDYSRNISDFQFHNHSGDAATKGENLLAGPLGALDWIVSEYFTATDLITRDKTHFSDTPNGVSALQFFDYPNSGTSGCVYRWHDPAPSILDAFNDILFVLALNAVPGRYTEFAAVQMTDTIVYVSNYKCLAVGSAILLLAIIAASAELWGWWQLGRNVTLSPLETARAFGALLFQNGSEMDAQDLARRTRGRRFVYGQKVEYQSDGVQREVLQFSELGIGNQ